MVSVLVLLPIVAMLLMKLDPVDVSAFLLLVAESSPRKRTTEKDR